MILYDIILYYIIIISNKSHLIINTTEHHSPPQRSFNPTEYPGSEPPQISPVHQSTKRPLWRRVTEHDSDVESDIDIGNQGSLLLQL